jgi:hypothetical protein
MAQAGALARLFMPHVVSVVSGGGVWHVVVGLVRLVVTWHWNCCTACHTSHHNDTQFHVTMTHNFTKAGLGWDWAGTSEAALLECHGVARRHQQLHLLRCRSQLVISSAVRDADAAAARGCSSCRLPGTIKECAGRITRMSTRAGHPYPLTPSNAFKSIRMWCCMFVVFVMAAAINLY